MSGWHLADLVPGLYLAALALLLAAALRRWFDPVPRRVFGLFALFVLLLLAPVLFGGKVLLPVQILLHDPPFAHLPGPGYVGNRLHLDLVSQIAPALALVRRAFAAGCWPLWNAYAGPGMPLLGDPQSQALQPLVLAAFPLSLERAVAVTAALRVLLALVFTFLFLRRQGISTAPATAGAVAFGLGGFVLLWLGWPIANGAVFLPMLLYAMVLVEERGARRDSALLALAVAGVLLTGQPEVAVNDLLLAAAFGVTRLATRSRRRWGPVARWSLAGLIALGLAAPALAPAADYLPQSHRDTRIERRNAQVVKESPFAPWLPATREKSLLQLGQRLLPIAAPNAFGNQRFGPYWGYSIVNEDATAFAGCAALLAALLAALPTPWRFRQERFFLGVAGLCLVVLARPPGLAQLLAMTPLLGKSATYQHRVVLPLVFAVAVLAACTLERWRAGELPRGHRLRTIVLALALAALVAWAYLVVGAPSGQDLIRSVRLGSLALHLLVIAGAAALLLAAPWRLPGGAMAAFVALVALELLLIHGPANPGMPRRLYFPTLPPIAFLQEQLGRDGSGARFGAAGKVFFANVPAVYGLPDSRYTNPLKPYPVAVAMQPVLRSIREIGDVLAKPDHPLYRLLGMRFQMTAPDGKLPPPWRPVFRDPAAWVWEQPRSLPRLFLPASAEVRPSSRWSPPGMWARWMENNRDFGERSLVLDDSEDDRSWRAPAGDGSVLRVSPMKRKEPERLGADARLGAARLMASSVYQDGGWRLLVDGRPRPMSLTNGPFVGAWLPAGRHRVDLVYRPRTFLPACLLAALAAAAALLSWVPPPYLRSGRP